MGEGALMPCAAARQSSWDDFTAFGNEIPECFRILVIYGEMGIGTEPANFPTMVDSFLSFGALTVALAV
jgi:hypothetical protein